MIVMLVFGFQIPSMASTKTFPGATAQLRGQRSNYSNVQPAH